MSRVSSASRGFLGGVVGVAVVLVLASCGSFVRPANALTFPSSPIVWTTTTIHGPSTVRLSHPSSWRYTPGGVQTVSGSEVSQPLGGLTNGPTAKPCGGTVAQRLKCPICFRAGAVQVTLQSLPTSRGVDPLTNAVVDRRRVRIIGLMPSAAIRSSCHVANVVVGEAMTAVLPIPGDPIGKRWTFDVIATFLNPGNGDRELASEVSRMIRSIRFN